MIALALAVLPLLAGAADESELIRVGEIVLDAASITERAREAKRLGAKLTPEQLVDAMVDEALLANEGRRVGLERDPAVRTLIENDQAAILSRIYDAEKLGKAIEPDEARLRELYHLEADTARLTLIVVATQKEAAAIGERLAKGGEWALEAARSLDPMTSRAKGDTGTLKRAFIPPSLLSHAFTAPLGAIVGLARVQARRLGGGEGGRAERRAGGRLRRRAPHAAPEGEGRGRRLRARARPRRPSRQTRREGG